jgi:hypothetical protein
MNPDFVDLLRAFIACRLGIAPVRIDVLTELPG